MGAAEGADAVVVPPGPVDGATASSGVRGAQVHTRPTSIACAQFSKRRRETATPRGKPAGPPVEASAGSQAAAPGERHPGGDETPARDAVRVHRGDALPGDRARQRPGA